MSLRVVIVVTMISMLASYLDATVLESSFSEAAAASARPPSELLAAGAILALGALIGMIFKLPIVFMLAPMLIAGVMQNFAELQISLPQEPLSLALVVPRQRDRRAF